MLFLKLEHFSQFGKEGGRKQLEILVNHLSFLPPPHTRATTTILIHYAGHIPMYIPQNDVAGE